MKILVTGDDPALELEVRSALAGLDVRTVVQFTNDRRQAVESARSREQDLALLALGEDLRAFKETAAEILAASPRTAVAALFDPQSFGGDRPQAAALIEVFRCGACDAIRRPVSSADLAQLLSRIALPQAESKLVAGRIVSFVSNKGGVGKSTMAVNVACGLAAAHPGEVLLVDAALQMGVCASMLDLRPRTTIADAVRERDRLDGVLLRQLAVPHPCGLHLLACPESAVEAADVDDEAIARVLNVARRSYRFVVVDTFPLLDRVVVAVLDLSDRLYLVTENVVPTLAGTRSLLRLLGELGVRPDRLKLILNRYTTAGGGLRPHEAAEQLGMGIEHVVPYHKQALVAANLGRPFIFDRSWFGPDRKVARVVQEVQRETPSPLETPLEPVANAAVDSPAEAAAPPRQRPTSERPARERRPRRIDDESEAPAGNGAASH